MAEFKKKNKHNLWYSPLVLGVLFCLFILFSYKMVDLLKKEKETHNKKLLALEQIRILDERKNILSDEIMKLNTNEGIENTIREKYQVVKKGEKMVIIVDEDKDRNLPVERLSQGFWNWVKGLFGSR